MFVWKKYEVFEKNFIVFVIGIFVVILVGGLVEIVLFFYLKSIIEKIEGMWFYMLLELVGCEIYICEGCYVCYLQMVWLMWDELEWYGYFLLVVEFMYDYLFQWGFKCIGLDLVWVGGKYFDDWYVEYMINLCLLVLVLIMFGYLFLVENEFYIWDIQGYVSVNMIVGVFYMDVQFEFVVLDVWGQVFLDMDVVYEFEEWWLLVMVCDFDGNLFKVMEMDVLVVYFQVFGIMVDFLIYDDKVNLR